MRCYFLRDGHICAVEVLADPPSDAEAIRLGMQLFHDRVDQNQAVHGFEIWDRARFVHRHPPPAPKFVRTTPPAPVSKSG